MLQMHLKCKTSAFVPRGMASMFPAANARPSALKRGTLTRAHLTTFIKVTLADCHITTEHAPTVLMLVAKCCPCPDCPFPAPSRHGRLPGTLKHGRLPAPTFALPAASCCMLPSYSRRAPKCRSCDCPDQPCAVQGRSNNGVRAFHPNRTGR